MESYTQTLNLFPTDPVLPGQLAWQQRYPQLPYSCVTCLALYCVVFCRLPGVECYHQRLCVQGTTADTVYLEKIKAKQTLLSVKGLIYNAFKGEGEGGEKTNNNKKIHSSITRSLLSGFCLFVFVLFCFGGVLFVCLLFLFCLLLFCCCCFLCFCYNVFVCLFVCLLVCLFVSCFQLETLWKKVAFSRR